jgi:ABC-type oligopeptide transport system ATPase subunit|tara:strand:- start:156 stop:1043 length:888 start_codon:yes stop_codon:yes gene_type:complete
MTKKPINILEINNLNVEFPILGGIIQREVSCVHAVKDFNLKIKEGETIAVVGESGSGKSTLGKAIINVLKLTAPDVRVTGEMLLYHKDNYIDLLKLNRKEMIHFRSDIQMIFQDPYSSLNPRMIVKDIIQEPMDIQGQLIASEREEKVLFLLNKVGLSKEQSTRYPHEFSGGQRQRIGIARALATDPKIIIADEPVSALDVSIQAQVINLMMDLQEEFNLTILFIAHDLSVVKHISTEIAVMYLGEVVEYGNTETVFSDPQHDYTKTLLESIPHPDPVGREERKEERLKLERFSM